ncbi:MAG: hypothetical protein ACI93T_004457, partial [Porticoccaceae bacterium]
WFRSRLAMIVGFLDLGVSQSGREQSELVHAAIQIADCESRIRLRWD